MALFRFTAVQKGEAPGEYLIEGESEKEALDKLRSRHITPLRSHGEVLPGRDKSLFFRRSKIDSFTFTRQLAPLLESFIPLEKALSIIAEGTEEKEQKDFVNSLRQGLHEGKRFSELVRSHGNVFPGYYANLIESGEETGCLPEVVNQLHKFMEQSKEFKDFIVSSSIYPLAILSITILVVVLLFTIFVPRFAKIFADMGRTLPPSMEFLMGMSAFASWAWWLIPLSIIL
ncbi:MAG: type II secretion system F family protein, partial [Lentisphaeria bacterium]|nr:type II secretion system F family protein [Lentisphaeria bacterium]